MKKYLEYMDITDSKMGDTVVDCVRSKDVDKFEKMHLTKQCLTSFMKFP